MTEPVPSSLPEPVPTRDRSPDLRRSPPLILSERECAVYLGVSERQVRALRSRRVLPFVRLGGRILYRLGEVNKALEKLEIRSA